MKKLPLLLIVILMLPTLQAQEWQTYESEHFTFYYRAGYLASEELETIAQNQEALFTQITTLLNMDYYKKIKYYLVGTREEFESIPGAYTMGSEIQFLCFFCVDMCKSGLNDAHELTHALSNDMGFQSGLLAEGLAVYVEDYVVNKVNLHGIIKILYTENRVTPLNDLADDFWCDVLFNYEIAGSFVTFLIEEYGMEKFKELYVRPPDPSSFVTVYGKSFETLEKEWLTTVEKAQVTQKEKDIVRYRDTIKEGLIIYFDMGFGPYENATYPARAEEGICKFREEYKKDPEKAFSYLPQFNEGMVAWKEAIDTFGKALQEENDQKKVELFEKAVSLYMVAGDEHMIGVSQKYAEAYTSLLKVDTLTEQGDLLTAEQELQKAESLFDELGEEDTVYAVRQELQALRDHNVEGFEALFVIVLACVLVGVFIKKRM